MHLPDISPKLAAAITPPLTAVVTAVILTNTFDRTSAAALAAIAIAAALGYRVPHTSRKAVAAAGGVIQPVTITVPPFPPDGPPLDVTALAAHLDSAFESKADGPADTGDDGDDHLPGDLAGRDIDAPPVDEVDVADLNHPEVN